MAHRGRAQEAAFNLDRVEPQLRLNGPLQNQMGLANLALKRWEKAQANAMVAEDNGLPSPGRTQLRALGKWQDTLTTPAAAKPADPASASRPRDR